MSQLKEVLLDVSEHSSERMPYEAVLDAVLAELPETRRNRCILSLVSFFDVLTTFLIMVGGVCNFDLSTFAANLLETNATLGFVIGTSTVDVVAVDSSRWCILFVCFALGHLCCSPKKFAYH